ncbi:MAG: hypothetical protein QHH14_10065 [Clostridiales bacterium]|nr:hypothetical protein [Clostridiales bacterium]
MRRSAMTKVERESRSQLKPYISWKEFIRATPTLRKQTCGKPNCKCQKGEKHTCLVLTRSHHGRPEQLYVPKESEEMVKEWVKNYHAVKELVEQISSSYWERLRKKG